MGLTWVDKGSPGISKALISGEVWHSRGEMPVLWSSLLVSLLLSCFYSWMEMPSACLSQRGGGTGATGCAGLGGLDEQQNQRALGFSFYLTPTS